jgi:hypothetical protein
MKTTARRTSLIDTILDEYVVWGGPVVTRREALADMQSRGFDARAIDISVFGRQAVEAPENPAEHVAFLRQIQAMGW